MPVRKKIQIILFISILVFTNVFFIKQNPVQAAYSGNSSGYAWSEQGGWISFETADDYGAQVADTYLDGYIWGEKIGYISLKRDSDSPDYGITNAMAGGEGKLSGQVWSEQAGYIKFAADGSDYSNDSAANYGVKIDSSGVFSGYAWGEKIGWISFSGSCDTGAADACDGGTYGVTTTWRPNLPPDAPVLESPANESAINDNTPLLSASYSDSDDGDTGKTYYRIAASAENCLAGTIIISGASSETLTNNATTIWTPPSSIGTSGTYYWCAQNNDGQDTSDWTSMGSFILNYDESISGVDLGGGGMEIEGIEFYE
ncbi:MAG: hypothetical protein WC323_00595 [Patescibacteria group bacterium]